MVRTMDEYGQTSILPINHDARWRIFAILAFPVIQDKTRSNDTVLLTSSVRPKLKGCVRWFSPIRRMPQDLLVCIYLWTSGNLQVS